MLLPESSTFENAAEESKEETKPVEQVKEVSASAEEQQQQVEADPKV